MTDKRHSYSEYVDHPRYGRIPNITGLNPHPSDPGVHLHWNSVTGREVIQRFESITGRKWPHSDAAEAFDVARRIPNTAIAADLTRQTPATIPVTHYFDLERLCRDCNRPFIFYAAEQKHWYEELGFGLDADCVRCMDCRKRQQGIARQRKLYEVLFHNDERTEEQTVAMAGACLDLVEWGVFSPRQLDHVRMLLNTISADSEVRKEPRFAVLTERVRQLATAYRSP